MRVEIKDGIGGCTGHGRCVLIAEEVYRLDDQGYNADRGKILEVAPHLEGSAAYGADVCPEQAIVILDKPTKLSGD
jgi:ferredoxin